MEIHCKWFTQMPSQIPTAPLPFTGLTIFVNLKNYDLFGQRKRYSKLDLRPVSHGELETLNFNCEASTLNSFTAKFMDGEQTYFLVCFRVW